MSSSTHGKTPQEAQSGRKAGKLASAASIATGSKLGFKNMKVGRKIGLGSGLILAFLIAASLVGFFGLSGADENFSYYRQTARESNQLGRIQANLLTARIAVKNFIQNQTEESIAVVNERIETLFTLIDEAEALLVEEQKIAEMEEARGEMQAYKAGFEEVTRLFRQRNEYVNQLNTLGPQAERDLTEIMGSAYRDGDAIASYRAGLAPRHLMLARLYANRFLIDNQPASEERALQEMDLFSTAAQEMLRELQNPTRRRLATNVVELKDGYKAAFEGVVEDIYARNEIIAGTLDTIGPRVADAMEEIKLENKNHQDTIGPETSAAMQRSV
jgi:methyl-accepting chemotaxis protein